MIKKLPTIYFIFGLLSFAFLFLNNSANPPNGKTGAPNENTCAQCHSGGSYNGNVAVTGIPSTIEPGQTYNVTVTSSFTGSPSPVRSGFQIVSLDESNSDAGTTSNVGSSAKSTVANSKTYVEHNPAKSYGANTEVSWTYDWTAPAGADGDEITFYFASVFGNGSGSSNDTVENDSYIATIMNGPGGGGGDPLTATIFFEIDANCNDGMDGSAAVLAEDGTAPYTYLWSDGQTNATATGLGAGTYTVVVSDALSATATATAVIDEPSAIEINILSQQDITCVSTGEIFVEATGGDSPYNYAWPSGGTSSSESGFTTAGLYDLTVTDDSSCSKVFSIEIFEDTEIPAISMPSTGDIDCTNPCFDPMPNVSSSSSNLLYQWFDNNGNTISTDPGFSLCMEGTFSLEVTNLDNGCTGAAQIIINDSSTTESVNISGNSTLTCVAPSTTLTASANGPGISFEWQNDTGMQIATGSSVEIFEGGEYTVVATFSTGCTNQSSISVFESFDSPNVIILEPDILTCLQTSVELDGSNSSSESGGSLSFEWVGPGSFASTTAVTNAFFSGQYTLTVTDELNGCISEESVEVVEDTELPMVAAISSNNIGCSNSTAILDGAGSSTGSDISYLWTTLDGNIVSGGTTLSAIVDAAGTYTLTVLNQNNGCSATASTVVEDNSTPPSVIPIVENPILNCSVTTTSIDGSGSSTGPSIVFLWSTNDGNIIGSTDGLSITVDAAGTYMLTVTNTDSGCSSSSTVNVLEDSTPPLLDELADALITCDQLSVNLDISTSNINGNICSWSGPNGFMSNEFIINVAEAGVYCVTITGTNSCTAESCTTIAIDQNGPVCIIAPPSTNLNCSNNTLNLSGIGSSTGPNFNYQWTTADGQIISGASTLNVEVNQVGTYTLIVTDNDNGCSSQASVAVLMDDILSISSSFTNISCNGFSDGSISIDILTGTAPFSYSWSNGSNSSELNNISSSTYEVTVVDANGCTLIESFVITEPSSLVLSLSANGETSVGGNDGNAFANVSGGSPSYSYIWSNGGTSSSIDNLSPGIYIVTVTDQAGCTSTDLVTVNEFGCDFDLQTEITDASCFGANDGSICLNTTGGQAPFTYTWSNGATTQCQNAPAGIYSVTITDAAGCIAVATTSLNEPAPLEIIINVNNIDCSNPDANVAASVSGGTQPYTFNWPSAEFPNGNIEAGTYTLIIMDANGCEAIENFTVSEDLNIPTAIVAPIDIEINCLNSSIILDGSASSSGNSISYEWLTANGTILSDASSNIITVGSSGVYTLTVTDNQNACTASTEILVEENTVIPEIVNDGLEAILSCTSSSIELSETPVNENYVYNWKNENGESIGMANSIIISECGTYFLCIEDITNGCTNSSQPIIITCDNTEVIADAGIAQILDCTNISTTIGGSNSSVGPNISYQWLDSSGNILGTLAEIIIDVCDTYTLIVTDDTSGCTSSDQVVVSCSMNVPVANAGSDFDIIGLCFSPDPNVYMLDGTASSTGVQFSYIWTTDDGNIVSGEDSLTPTIDSPGTYSLTVLDANTNCSSVDNVSVGITSNGVPVINIAAFENLNCINSTVTLSGSSSTSSGTLSFEWSDSNNNILSDMASIDVDEPGLYTLIVQDEQSQCTAEASAVVIEETLEVSFDFIPLTCRQDSVIVILDVDGFNPPYMIDWGDGLMGDSVLIELGPPQTFTITDAIGCSLSASTGFIDPAEPIIAIINSEVTPSSGNNGMIDISVIGLSPPFNFIWSNGEVSEDISNLTPGDYTVTITDDNGCELIETFMVDLIESVLSAETSGLFSIYPNPTSGPLIISSSLDISKIELFDLNGKLRFDDRVHSRKNYSLTLEKKGIYILKIFDAQGKSYFQKIVKF